MQDYINHLSANGGDLGEVIDRELQDFAAVLNEFATNPIAYDFFLGLFFTSLEIVKDCMALQVSPSKSFNVNFLSKDTA